MIRSTGNAGLCMLSIEDEFALTTVSASLWYKRVGHLNMASVKRLEKPMTGEMCSQCVQGKQHKGYN